MAPKIAVGQRQPAKQERFVPGIHSVQGINSKIDDLKLRGQRLTAMIGEAILDVSLNRKVVGASELIVTILDPTPHRRLLRSALLEEAHELVLDGLHWKLVKVSNEGQNAPLVLTYEPLIVYLLKQLKGPHKAFRDKMTRAEFAQARAYEARPRPRFIAPELHVVQDIATAKQGKEAKKTAEESRGKGIGNNPTLQINGKPATKAQVDILERMLRVAESNNAPSKVMEALVVTCIDESVVGTLTDNLLEQEPFTAPNTDHTNPEESALGFLLGYDRSEPGAIGYAKANPGASVAEICTNVQHNRDGATPYERFTDEGRAWVAAYGGGSDVGTLSTQRYAFQQTKKESNWHCMVRLAGEVHWRCFESAAWIYFLDEPTLLRSHHRMLVSDSAPGIVDTTFDYDIGKEVQEVTVEAMANVWGAPPGTVASVSRHGPADGLYIVESIESKPSSRSGLCNIVLKKPTKPLPEPSPKTSRGSASFGGNGTAPSDAPPAVAKALEAMIAEIEALDGTPYSWGGGHESADAVKNRLSKYDCSGYMSRILYVGGLLDHSLTSGPMASLFGPGKGNFFVIYANANHVWGEIKTASGWKEFEEGGSVGHESGWLPSGTQSSAGYSARHPKGF